MRVYIETYGCAASIAETEIMAGLLQRAGYDIVKSPDIADVILIQACFVKMPTEQKILSRIANVQKMYPRKKLIITGCMPEGAYSRVRAIAPAASLVSTHHITKIAQAMRRTIEGEKAELLGERKEIKLCLPKIRKNPVIDTVPIASGCSGSCAYCCVRFAKGRLFSYPPGKILDEIKLAVREGCKEIWLTAQDTAAYGLDTARRHKLPDLLNKVSALPGRFNVRVGMANPDNIKAILPELIAAFNSKKIYKFIHVPVQSGDDGILAAMGRRYTVKEFEQIVDEFKRAFRCQIWTDIIVGYPRETEAQFRRTLLLLKRARPDYVNVSRFCPRPGTPAAKLPKLPSEVIKRRSRIASDLVHRLALEANKAWIGWSGEILISEQGKRAGQWIGRNFAYKQVVINSSAPLLGKFVKVKILDAAPTALHGWLLKP